MDLVASGVAIIKTCHLHERCLSLSLYKHYHYVEICSVGILELRQFARIDAYMKGF